MFQPLTQGKESRIVADDHLVVPGRFRAHPQTVNGTSAASPAAPTTKTIPHASSSGRGNELTASPRTPTRRRRLPSQRFREELPVNERSWLLRPTRERVESWLDAWWKRWMLLVIVPAVIVWTWCAIPFPVSDPYNPSLPWPEPGWNWTRPSSQADIGMPSSSMLKSPVTLSATATSQAQATPTATPQPTPQLPDDLPVDVNFLFFLIVYYGAYLAVALVWVTCLFNLYRLNWWPRKLGGAASYAFFWSGALCVGAFVHYTDLFGMEGKRRWRSGKTHAGDSIDWERKTMWVSLAFGTMAMPALVCFGKLRRDRRMTYRHSLTEMQKTFLERQIGRRIPKSYIRFLWFIGCIAIALIAGLAGQAYMSVYLGTLPHGSVESVVYVWTWIISCSLLGTVTTWILEKKVGSRALDFVFRLYFQLTYHVFYRTLFARLRKAEQFLYLQTLSSVWVVTFYPAYMSRTAYKIIGWSVGNDRPYSDYAENIATSLYIRNLSENVTMVAFLGWLTILHFGPNREVYPFFDFSSNEQYNYERTAISSLIIWVFELLSSFVARAICYFAFKMDVTNTGLDTLREFPELLPACVWVAIHVCMDVLLFLVRYNFR